MIALLLAVSATGLCPLPEAAPSPDPATAAAYLDVGAAEMAAGSPATALLAYREALREAPASERAREGYLTACEQASPAAALAWGRAEVDRGDCGSAIAVLARLRKGRRDRAAALLQGICAFELGDDEAARPLLEEAREAPDLAARASYFLGLVSLRNGLGTEAAGDFEQTAAQAGPLAERAAVLRLAALRSGRAVIALGLESGYDSNVNYTPDGRPASPDGGGGASLGFALRPWGLSGPYLRANGYYRAQFQLHNADYGDFGAQLGYRLGRGETYAFADYTADASVLGGAAFESQHALRAGGQWQLKRFALSAVYGVRFATYQTPLTADFSGTLQTLDVEAAYYFHLGSSVYLGYHGGRDVAAKAYASSFEHGPGAGFRWVIRPTLRTTGRVSWLWRGFDDLDPAVPTATSPRADSVLFFGGGLEQDLLDRFTAGISVGNRIASSTDPGYSYSRLTAFVSLGYTAGLF